MLSVAVKRDRGAWCALVGKQWVQAGDVRAAMELSRRFTMYGIEAVLDRLEDMGLNDAQRAEIAGLLSRMVYGAQDDVKVKVRKMLAERAQEVKEWLP